MISRFFSRPLLRLRPAAVLTPRSASSHSTSSSLPTPNQALPPLPWASPSPGSTWRRPLLGAQWPRAFSSKREGGGTRDDADADGSWKLTVDNEDGVDDLLAKSGVDDAGAGLSGLDGNVGAVAGESWPRDERKGDIFQKIDGEQLLSKKKVAAGEDDWETAQGYKPWGFEEDEGKGEAFQFGEEQGGLEGLRDGELEDADNMKAEQLNKEEQELLTKLKGPNRAFGDLIAASGITEDMIDSLILLKNLRGVQGLPPLREIADMPLAKDVAPSARYEMEKKKQEEVAKARIRQVDEKGRAYGTGKRKCSIARVWIEPGEGRFVVNDKQFDIYFPIIDHRADLLRPFTATKTLGLFDVNCTVKGGGVSGQVGAVRLGISRALQNFEPGLRENLRSAGFLTRDSRVVERKKPGKAKARKSFQWVKR